MENYMDKSPYNISKSIHVIFLSNIPRDEISTSRQQTPLKAVDAYC